MLNPLKVVTFLGAALAVLLTGCGREAEQAKTDIDFSTLGTGSRYVHEHYFDDKPATIDAPQLILKIEIASLQKYFDRVTELSDLMKTLQKAVEDKKDDATLMELGEKVDVAKVRVRWATVRISGEVIPQLAKLGVDKDTTAMVVPSDDGLAYLFVKKGERKPFLGIAIELVVKSGKVQSYNHALIKPSEGPTPPNK